MSLSLPRMPFYYGRWGYAGHFLYAPSGRTAEASVPAELLRRLDGGFLLPDRASLAAPDEQRQPQGLARLSHEDGWTILGFWDRSADHRMGSHSTFLLPEPLDFDQAVRAARRAFPAVWGRIDAAGIAVRLAG